jgi:hypothetical protein
MRSSNRVRADHRTRPAATRRLRSALLLLPVILLAACGPQGRYPSPYGEIGPSGIGAVPHHYYPPPGPPEDPWGPYIREAAARYSVPEQWIRAVMQQESGGEEQAVSPVGAMGLMQVMPDTYAGLRERYALGDDPFEPHNNILAGSGYIREMYERFGSPGFLAGYNAGPDRVDEYLAGTARLPDETVNYLAAITPNLGNAVPMSGPLAVYASARPSRGIVVAGASVTRLAAGCDLNAAYDPNHPCTSLEQAALAAAPPTGANGCDLNAAYDPQHPCTSLAQAAAVSAPQQQAFVRQAAAAACDPNAAYDPDHPCRSPAPAIRVAALSQSALPRREIAAGCDPNAAYDPAHPCRPTREAAPRIELAAAENCDSNAAFDPKRRCRYQPVARHPPVVAVRDWAIQVGAFANPALARAVAEGARAQAPNELRAATLVLPPTPYRGSVLYRARLAHLSARAAADACTQLNRRQLPCIVVQPNRS